MTTNIRLRNLLTLHRTYAQSRVTSGESLAGLESAFAQTLDVKVSMWSQIKAGRTVGNILARQFESKWNKPEGWLDEEHPDTAPDPAEEKFLALCRQAWSKASREEKAELKRVVSQVVKKTMSPATKS